MLSVLRQNANNWFMILLFAIITIVFVFTFGSWGGNDVSGKLPVAATVNGRVVSKGQFESLYSSTFRQMQMFRQGYSLDMAKQEDLRGKVLDRLVGQELLAQMAEDRGLVVTDEEVVSAIKERYFGPSRPFTREEYKRLVNGVLQTNEARFEDQVRRELLAEKVRNVITEAQQVSPGEIREAFDARYNRVNVEVLQLDPAFFKVAEASDDEVKSWADANAAKLEEHYNKFINRYRQPKKVKARHILAKVAADAPDADKAAARKKVEDALARVKGGEDFAKVAQEVSEDSSAAEGGDLGFFGPGMMVKPFEDTAFAMTPGELSGVVETKFGFHVIKVEEVQEASVKELADVRLDIAKSLIKETASMDKAMKVANKAVADLKAGTAMGELSIEGFAGSLTERNDDRAAPRVQDSGMFNSTARFVRGVGVSEEAVTAAFALTEDAPISAPLEVRGRVYVMKLKERERPDESKFDSEREVLSSTLLSQRRASAVDAFVKELMETADIVRNTEILSYGS